MVTYASYRRRRSNLTSPGLVVAFANSSFEILAGIGVFATGDPVPAVLEALPEFPDVLESAHNYLSQIPLIEEN